jgi:hypothetical protein
MSIEGHATQWPTEKGHATQWPTEKGHTMVNKTLQRKLKIVKHESH